MIICFISQLVEINKKANYFNKKNPYRIKETPNTIYDSFYFTWSLFKSKVL